MFRREILWGIVIFTFLPLVILAFFNIPIGDDLHCAAAMRDMGLVDGFWYLNSTWNSRYVQSVLLLVLNPASYGSLGLFWMPPLILIMLFAGSLYGLLRLVAGQVLSRDEFYGLYVVLLFFYFNYIPEIGESLYWISGSYTYQVPIIISLNVISLYILLFRSNSGLKKVIITFALVISSFLLIGLHEEAMAYMIGFTILISFWLAIKKNRHWIYTLVILLFSIGFSYIVLKSQAFFSRGFATGLGTRSILTVGLEAAGRTLFYLMTWIPAFILFFSFLAPVMKKISNKFFLISISKKRYQILFLVGCTLIVFSGFFIPLYATGWMPPRSVSIPFLVFILMFFIILIIVDNPLMLFLNEKQRNVVLVLLVIIMSSGHNVFDAYTDLTAGKAKAHRNFVMASYSRMSQADKGDTLYISPLPDLPVLMPVRWPQHERDLSCAEMSRYFKIYIDIE